MVAVGETISGWKLGRGRGSRLYSGDSRNRRAVCAGTVPMVNNLYQGMPLDPATGLYYERARWYSPSLGTWISQDPAQYVNGADTYQFVTSNPVGAVDPWGLAGTPGAMVPWGQQLQDIQILNSVLNGWYASGDLFAWRLLTAFLSNGFPSGHAGLTFEFAAIEIKSDPLYREKAMDYFRWYAYRHGVGAHSLRRHWPGANQAFSVSFYSEWGTDLMYALGGGHFGFTAGEVIVKRVCTSLGPAYEWRTVGLEMVQRDHYTFPAGLLRTGWLGRLLFPAYGAAYDYQHAGFGSSFWHHEVWRDHFSGYLYLNYPISPPSP